MNPVTSPKSLCACGILILNGFDSQLIKKIVPDPRNKCGFCTFKSYKFNDFIKHFGEHPFADIKIHTPVQKYVKWKYNELNYQLSLINHKVGDISFEGQDLRIKNDDDILKS